MTDNARKVSELPVANTIGNSDRLIFLYNANTGAPSARTIAVSNFTTNLISGPYDDDTLAAAGNIPVKGLYYTSEGVVKIRLT